MRLIACFAALLLVAGCTPDAGGAGRSSPEFDYLSLHWEAVGPSNDVRWCDLFGSGESVPLDPEAVLGMHHFAGARTARREGSGTHFVEIVMTPEGHRRMKEISSRNLGRRLAIVVDDEIFALAQVWRTVDTDAFNLPTMADERTAREIAERIDAAINAM